ncbi:MAG: glycine--tRNA ligase subunit beta [Wenzhouxiangella sp.]|jgi:glycyl-tRNA synthetase beta chain|nr:glycine--tRNA ligase subunit beta [Wenzhouxiangella sp.]
MNTPSDLANPLLLELGCEELPAGQIERQLQLLGQGLKTRLLDANLIESGSEPTLLGTPRRLAVCFESVRATQPDQVLERKGPAESSAFDDQGQPTRAAEGFARSVNLTVDQLERLETEQGRWLFARVHRPGRSLAELLPDMLDATVQAMAGARSMRWSDRTERFLRPVRWLLVLHGDRIVPVSAFGLTAGRETQGHRIHAPGAHTVDHADHYATVLRRAFVEPDAGRRRDKIRVDAERLAREVDLEVVIEESLLHEVAGLTEWPVAIVGGFDERFLEVPAEALISSMQQHQKCFPLRQRDGRLAAKFIAVANIESTNVAAMTEGFERVIRPRLADARFFFEQDRRTPLADRLSRLHSIKFQEKLGSLAAKTARLQALGAELARLFGADIDAVRRAATLSKCDLVTEMVGEFPELQGIMGHHYALADGETEFVARAIESHYLPRHSGDDLPADPVGQCLALADRLDTLVGIFAAGQKPKGGKDPFALRRAALAVIRILEVAGVETPLRRLLERAAETLAADLDDRLAIDVALIDEVEAFVLERLRSHAADLGIETNTVHAVAASGDRSVSDFLVCARAVQAFADDPRADTLIGANKRIANLLRQADDSIPASVNSEVLVESVEKALASAVADTAQRLDDALSRSDYRAALEYLANLRDPVDQFFDGVMVMADDEALRKNRLALLAGLREQFLRVADVARLGR